MRDVLYVIFYVLLIPVLAIEYGKVFPIAATIATCVSTYLFYSAQSGFTPLFWTAFSLSIVNIGLNTLKLWMARKKGMIFDDLGAIPAGWSSPFSASHQIATFAGIGLFTTSIVLAIKAGVLLETLVWLAELLVGLVRDFLVPAPIP